MNDTQQLVSRPQVSAAALPPAASKITVRNLDFFYGKFQGLKDINLTIAEGRVTINGETVREMGVKVDPATADIRVDGRRVKPAERHRYILLYKPAGYVTTRSDPERRRTVTTSCSPIPSAPPRSIATPGSWSG